MAFQFSGIDVQTEVSTFKGFRANVMTGILRCMGAYSTYFSQEEKEEIKAIDIPANMIQAFFRMYETNKVPYPIYILIDEYDQFTNELVGLDTERFRAIVGSSGYVPQFL